MAIVKTPARVQPAFNEVIVSDDSSTTLRVSSVAPSPVVTTTLSHVLINGRADFDLKGFLSKLFYDSRVAIDTGGSLAPWVYLDQRLAVTYKISGDDNVYLALNAVRQTGEGLDMYEGASSPALTRREERNGHISIPMYEGYPTGVTVMALQQHEPDFWKAMQFRITTTGEGTRVFSVTITSSATALNLVTDEIYTSRGGALDIEVSGAGEHTIILWGGGTISWPSYSSTCYLSHIDFWNASIKVGSCILQRGLLDIPDQPIPFNIGTYSGTGADRVYKIDAYFRYCTSLRGTLPRGLFSLQAIEDGVPVVMVNTFESTWALRGVPDDLFAYFPTLREISGVLSNSVISVPIPPNLFERNHLLEREVSTFASSWGVTSIPAGLFASTSITHHENTFARCPVPLLGLDPIFSPASKNLIGVFARNTALHSVIFNEMMSNMPDLTSVRGMFSRCTQLPGVEDAFFENNPAITDFREVFDGCTAMALPTPAPAGLKLWQRAGADGYPATIDGTAAFRGCTNAADYNEIPDNWK